MRTRVSLPASEAGLVLAIRAARGFAAQCSLSATATDRLCVVVEEWLSNVIEHGEPALGSRLMMRLEQDHGGLRATFTDAGQAFDPRHTPAFEGPNTERGGGAGLELVRAWADIADYRYTRGRNRLVLLVST